MLDRWDADVLALLSRIVEQGGDLVTLTESIIDELFDFMLSKRDWVAVSARAALGEGLPKRISLREHGCISFMDSTMSGRKVGALQLDPGLMLITVEGILQHHVLSTAHYRELYGKDVTDAGLKLRTKKHLRKVVLALIDQSG